MAQDELGRGARPRRPLPLPGRVLLPAGPGIHRGEDVRLDVRGGGARGPRLRRGARGLGEAFAAEDPEDLLVDYTRIFLGPVEHVAKPYGSVWLGRPAGADAGLDDGGPAALREGGFEIDEDFREFPDHVAAELEFLYLLIFRETEAAQKDDRDAAGGDDRAAPALPGRASGRLGRPVHRGRSEGAQTPISTGSWPNSPGASSAPKRGAVRRDPGSPRMSANPASDPVAES